jgi:transketolase
MTHTHSCDLQNFAKTMRKKILDLAVQHKDGHIASSFSTVEILVALYERVMAEEDKFILSKGHGCLSLYCMLHTKGFNPKISGHPDIEPEQGICCTTGSLGHGLPIGVGMAIAKKIQKKEGHVFVMIGDGECQEGTIWESLNLAKKFRLDNLTIIVDHNKLQALSTIEEIMNETNLKSKFEVFGCNTLEIDGHDFEKILEALEEKNVVKGKSRAIIAHTIKGKGISYMENIPKWHSCLPEGELLRQAYQELQ